MGMFDWVQCDYPLPGTKLEFVDKFQSKSFDCVMSNLKILENGDLEGAGIFTGTITFYGCNIVAAGPAGEYTKNGEDVERVTYEVSFTDSKLKEISQVHYQRYAALASKEMPKPGNYKKGSTLNEKDSFLGQKLYVLWGGRDEGHEIEVVYETDRQLCVKDEKGMLELMHQSQIGSTIFKDVAEAKADREYFKDQIEKEKSNYQKKLAEKRIASNDN